MPTEKELKSINKSGGTCNQFLRHTMTEKELKRKTEISKIQKTAMKRTSIRAPSNKGQTDLHHSTDNLTKHGNDSVYLSAYGENESHDDNESFKSFAMDADLQHSQMSSMIDESKFEDAIDDPDVWFVSKQNQHFSQIPILTMKSFTQIAKLRQIKDDGKAMFKSMTSHADLKKSTKVKSSSSENDQNFANSNFQLSHYLVDSELIEDHEDSDSASEYEEEKQVKLESSTQSKKSTNELLDSVIEVKIDFTRHKRKQKKNDIFLADIEIKTLNVLVEVTPSSIIHICSLCSPFEYFYNSSLDSALPNFKQLIHASYTLPVVPTASKENSSPSDK